MAPVAVRSHHLLETPSPHSHSRRQMGPGASPKECKEAIRTALMDTEAEFIRYAQAQGLEDGTTALLACIADGYRGQRAGGQAAGGGGYPPNARGGPFLFGSCWTFGTRALPTWLAFPSFCFVCVVVVVVVVLLGSVDTGIVCVVGRKGGI